MNFPRIIVSGGYSLTIEFCREISRECIEKVHGLYYSLINVFEKEIKSKDLEVVVGLSGLTIYYDSRIFNGKELFEKITRIISKGDFQEIPKSRVRKWVIPVLYGGINGPDLEEIASMTGLSINDVVRIHSSRTYLCYAIGFTPGFIYLGEVDKRIAVPRLKTPRVRVPAGSIGIAGVLTGIYSVESPGGWRIIGRTPLKLFDLKRSEPMVVKPGDLVVFKPIDEELFRELENVFIGDYVDQ